MPELPEVESVRLGLLTHAVGRRICRVTVFSDRAVRRHLAGRADFESAVAGHQVLDVRRRGKYLWWVLEDDDAILAHLGMSGQFRVGSAGGSQGGPLDHPHLRVRFTFDDAGHIDFLDQRTFGGMVFLPGQAELPGPIRHLARDPMDPAFSLDGAVAAIRRRRTELKRALLDQTVISGIGNIYADEALWRARVNYARSTAALTRPVVRRVLHSAEQVLAEALAAGGTSFDALYVNVNGESGYFDRSLAAYGRQDRPCPRCGAPIRRDPFMNRSSFYCPVCQPRPRLMRRSPPRSR